MDRARARSGAVGALRRTEVPRNLRSAARSQNSAAAGRRSGARHRLAGDRCGGGAGPDPPASDRGDAAARPRRRHSEPLPLRRRRLRRRGPGDVRHCHERRPSGHRGDQRDLAGTGAAARPAVRRRARHDARSGAGRARRRSARARLAARARGCLARRSRPRAGRAPPRRCRRPAGRARRALRPGGAGRDTRHAAPAPQAARTDARRDGRRRRDRHRRRVERPRRLARRGDGERNGAAAAARPLARLGRARHRVARVSRRGGRARRRRHVECLPQPGRRTLLGGGMVSNAVELRDVFRVFSTPEGDAAALQGLSLSIGDGELVAVLGPSGSGKTTLLRLLAGLDRPSAGRVSAFGRDLAKLPARQVADYRTRTLGYADQHYSLMLASELTAHDLVTTPLALRGEPRGARDRRADELLERVGLLDRRGAHPTELSGGEQQRIAVCAALAHRPRLFLADEPTGELDAENARRLFELIGDLVRTEKATTVLVSHDPAAATVADRVVTIRDGRVAAEAVRDHEGGADTIVVGRGGWLRLPEEYLRRAGIVTHASARLERDEIVVSGVEPVDKVPGTEVLRLDVQEVR